MPIHVDGLTIGVGTEGDVFVRGPTRFAGTVVEGGDLVPITIAALAALLGAATQPIFVDDGSGGFDPVYDNNGNQIAVVI